MLWCRERVLREKVVTKGRMVVRGVCGLGLGVWRVQRLWLGEGEGLWLGLGVWRGQRLLLGE